MPGIKTSERFNAELSHELRNPLTAVKTALYALKSGLAGPISSQQRKFVDTASLNVERQIRMVRHLLDIDRAPESGSRIELRRVDLLLPLSQIEQEFGYCLSPRLEMDVPATLPAVLGDPELVAQALWSLVDNAFRSARSRMSVRAEKSGSEVVVGVIDDGPGIPSERLKRSFDGLVLSKCKSLVDRLGGRLWVESALGEGSRFFMSLAVACE